MSRQGLEAANHLGDEKGTVKPEGDASVRWLRIVMFHWTNDDLMRAIAMLIEKKRRNSRPTWSTKLGEDLSFIILKPPGLQKGNLKYVIQFWTLWSFKTIQRTRHPLELASALGPVELLPGQEVQAKVCPSLTWKFLKNWSLRKMIVRKMNSCKFRPIWQNFCTVSTAPC